MPWRPRSEFRMLSMSSARGPTDARLLDAVKNNNGELNLNALVKEYLEKIKSSKLLRNDAQ